MDEPPSNLDAKLGVSMRASLSQCTNGRRDHFYVTHDQAEAMTRPARA
jgi:multiple sugar transport system ATP-binding protein